MACPDECVLGQNLTFTAQFLNAVGSPVAADAAPAYKVFEDETGVAILAGNMAALGGETGFYSEQIACTTANGFERYKSYSIRITGAVGGVDIANVDSFICYGVEDIPRIAAGVLVTTLSFKAYAGITDATDDALIGSLINRATSAIERFCDRTLRSATHTEWYDGDDTTELFLREWPVTGITYLGVGRYGVLRLKCAHAAAYAATASVSATTLTCSTLAAAAIADQTVALSTNDLDAIVAAVNAFGSSWSASVVSKKYGDWDGTMLFEAAGLHCLDEYAYLDCAERLEYNFRLKDENGRLYLPTGFPPGIQNIVVKYTAGYVTTPADLEQICIDLVNIYYRGRKKDLTIKAERLGDHAITFAGEGGGMMRIPDHIAQRLAPYRKWSNMI